MRWKTPSTKTLLLSTSAVVVLGVGIVILNSRSDSSATTNTPTFQTVLPAHTTIGTLGGWHRVSPPDNTPVYAYNDMIDNVPVSVSQQELPPSFQQDTASRVADLAKGYDTMNVNGLTVYIGTSSKGPQSVIFTTKQLLIMIKSQQKISNETWKAYVASLR